VGTRSHASRLRLRPAATVLAGALAARAWRRGLHHPPYVRRGATRAPTGQNRPARHRAFEARFLGVAARRTKPLPNGSKPKSRRRGRSASKPRARELVCQQTSIVNRMKACLIWLGVRNFKPTLRRASERLETLRTLEGVPLPPNTLAEIRRDMARLRLVREQIREIEAARSQRLQVSEGGAHAMVKIADADHRRWNRSALFMLTSDATTLLQTHFWTPKRGSPMPIDRMPSIQVPNRGLSERHQGATLSRSRRS